MMDFTKIKKLTIGGVELKQLFVGGIQVWKSGYKNWVKYSTEADGVTIYNGGLGYKYGYRIRSGGAESAESDAKPSIIGYIPCKAGDIIRFCYENGVPIWMDEGNVYMTCLNFFDSSKANLGQLTSQPADYGIFDGTNEFNKIKKVGNYWEYTVANNVNIAFVRFTVPPATWGGANNADKLIITINEEIE